MSKIEYDGIESTMNYKKHFIAWFNQYPNLY